MTTISACLHLLRRTSVRWRAGTVLAVLLASSLAACGGGGDSDRSAASQVGAPTTNAGTTELTSTFGEAQGPVPQLDWGLPFGEPDTINPPLSTYYSSMFTVAQMCDSLLRQQPDFSAKPGLATVTQTDPKTVDIELREGIKFWNGNEATSADVKYMLEQSVKSHNVGLYFASIRSIDVTDRYHVTLHLKAPDARLLGVLTTYGKVYEKKFAEQAGEKFGTSEGGIMCTGPYELVEWNPGTSIELKANPDYWDPEYKPHAETVSLKFFTGSTALAAALAAGEIDGAYEVPAQTIPRLESAESGELHYGPSIQWYTLTHARSGGTLASPKLRQALMFKTIDGAALAKVVFHGAAAPSYAMVPPNLWDPDAQDQWAQAYKPFEEAGKRAGTPEALAEAKQLVEESGYSGDPVVLAILAGDVTMENVAQLIQQQASQIGVNVKISPLPSIKYAQATYDASARTGLDLLLISSFAANRQPLEVTPYETLPDQAYNWSGYSDPRVTKLMTQALRTLDTEKRVALQVDAQEIYEQEFENATPVYLNQISFLNNRLSGMTTSFAYAFTPSLARIGSAE